MVYRISAPTPEEKDEWIHSIKYANGKQMRWSHSRGENLRKFCNICLFFNGLILVFGWCVYLFIDHADPAAHCVPVFSVQICRECGSLLRDACCQEETYISEEGGTTVDVSFHSLPVFLCLLPSWDTHFCPFTTCSYSPLWGLSALPDLVIFGSYSAAVWHTTPRAHCLSRPHSSRAAFRWTVNLSDHVHINVGKFILSFHVT